MSEDSNRRLCHICVKLPAVGKEHLPGKATKNKSKMEIRFIDGENIGNGVKHNYLEFPDGFWVKSLCRKCNEKVTGSRLGGQYKEFVEQIDAASGIQDRDGKVFVNLKNVYPLRIIKQMFSMFLSAMPKQPFPDWHQIQQFVFNKNAKLPAGSPPLYLYKVTSEHGRIVPWCGISEIFSGRKLIFVSEIAWSPLGIIFCDSEDKRFASMENITDWGQYEFRDKKNLVLKLPELKIASDHPLAFGTKEEVERWRTEAGVIWAVGEPEYRDSPTNTSMVLRRK